MIPVPSKKIRIKANDFSSEYNVKKINPQILRAIISSQGYKIIEFSQYHNDKNVEDIIEALGVNDYIRNRSAFIYQDSEYRFLFIQGGLSEKETLVLLAHEEAHIYLDHTRNKMILGQDINDEYEANEFVHYLLNQSLTTRLACYIANNKARVLLYTLAIAVILCSGIFAYSHYITSGPLSDYYVVETGGKFHVRNCRYVENRNDVRQVTEREINKHKYEPCKVCLPDYYDNK